MNIRCDKFKNLGSVALSMQGALPFITCTLGSQISADQVACSQNQKIVKGFIQGLSYLYAYKLQQLFNMRDDSLKHFRGENVCISHHIRKPTTFKGENKGAVTAQLISAFVFATQIVSAFVFATQIVQSLFFLNSKLQAPSLLLWLYRPDLCLTWSETTLSVFS